MFYSADIESSMKAFYETLSEKDRRRYAAVEAAKLGHGGIEYISTILGCDPKTIRRGRRELQQVPDSPEDRRVRKKGGASMLSLLA
jgi:hypothetical protein